MLLGCAMSCGKTGGNEGEGGIAEAATEVEGGGAGGKGGTGAGGDIEGDEEAEAGISEGGGNATLIRCRKLKIFRLVINRGT